MTHGFEFARGGKTKGSIEPLGSRWAEEWVGGKTKGFVMMMPFNCSRRKKK